MTLKNRFEAKTRRSVQNKKPRTAFFNSEFILIPSFIIFMLLISAQSFGQLTASVSNLTDVKCFGQATGSVTISGSGGTEPYEYKIDGHVYKASGVFSFLEAGTYVFIVRDHNLATANVSVTISQPDALEIDLTSQTNVECVGYESGVVDISVSGGTAGYTYAWSTGDGYGLEPAVEDQTGLAAGTYILIVTDANGCQADLSVTITEGHDVTTPVITGGANGTAECTGSNPSLNPEFLAWRNNFAGITATDNCGIESISFDDAEWASNGCVDENTSTFTVTDKSGNTSTTNFSFRIVDTSPPVLTGGADHTAESTGLNPGLNPYYMDWRDNFAYIYSADICGSTSLAFDEGEWIITDDADIITVHFVATDECGLTSVVEYTCTIVKTGALTILCPADITVECFSDVPAADISQVSYTGEEVVITHVGDVSDGNTCPEIITRTYLATDKNDNKVDCRQLITIQDIIPPTISCPGPVFVNDIDEVPVVDISLVNATDNCTGNPEITFISDVYNDNGCSPIITRTYMATDDCGNSTTCTQLIMIDDNIPPSIICPPPIEVACRADIPQADIHSVVVEDNCPVTAIIHVGDVSDGHSCPETIMRVYRATDGNGNFTECIQTIIVHDHIPPVLVGVPEDMRVDCNSVPDPPEVTATDNCSPENGLVVTYTEIYNSVENCTGVIVRQWVATDECGNFFMDTQTIIVTPATGMENISDVGSIELFPNPTTGIINIRGLGEPAYMELISMQGKLLKSESGVQNSIDISELDGGIYFIKILLTDGQFYIKAIIKE